jgi:hypothetical protein
MSFTSSVDRIRNSETGEGETGESATGECETGTWKVDPDFEAEVCDCEFLLFPTGRGDARQEFRALLERMQRRAGRPGLRQRR